LIIYGRTYKQQNVQKEVNKNKTDISYP